MSGDLDVAGEQVLRGLLAGIGPDGQPLVGEVRRSDPRARGLTRATHGTVGVRANVAVRVAAAAGLDAHAIYAAAAPDSPDLLRTALGHLGGRVDARRAGVDLTFFAPSSVSLLFAFGDPRTVAAVRAAHERAIGEALAYLEQVAGHGLRGHNGDGQRAHQVPTVIHRRTCGAAPGLIRPRAAIPPSASTGRPGSSNAP